MKCVWVGTDMWHVGVKRCPYYGLSLHLSRVQNDERHDTTISLPEDVARSLFDELLNVVVNGITEVGSQMELADHASQDDSPRAVAPSTPATETT